MKCVNNHPEQTVNILDLTEDIDPYKYQKRDAETSSPTRNESVGGDVPAPRFLFMRFLYIN